MPKNGYLDSLHPSYALRARSAGAPRLRIRIPPRGGSAASAQDLLPRALGILRLSSRAQNPDSQRVRKGFFTPKNGYLDSSHPPCPTAMCFLLLFSHKACAASQTCSKVLFVAYAMRREHSWRIRLAAYGARLERVLG